MLKTAFRKNKVIIYSILSIFLILFLIQFLFLSTDPLFNLKMIISYSYLHLVEGLANIFLFLAGSEVYYYNSNILLDNNIIHGFQPFIRFEKLTLILILFICIVKSPIVQKMIFSVLLFLTHLFFNSVYIAQGALFTVNNGHAEFFSALSITIWLMTTFTIIFFWYRKNKEMILERLSSYKINVRLIQNDISLISIVYIFIIISSFIIEIFDFKLWIDLLFNSSQYILEIFGYDAIVEDFRLIGEKSIISMTKSCLGFQMMLVFVLMIVLTGERNPYRWIFILAGLIFLNLVNIFRFVFLFMHMETKGAYMLVFEAHGLFNFITYVVVFLLWLLWFEKFADRTGKRQHPPAQRSDS